MKKAEAVRRILNEFGFKLSNREVIAKAKEKFDLEVKITDIYSVRSKLERTKPVLDFDTLRKIRKFADEIGGVNLLQEGVELLKSLQIQENNY